MSIATEIVTFKTVEGVAADEFTAIVDQLEKNFHAGQPGFIDTELLHSDKTDEWIMIQHWTGLEDMKAASRKMFNNPVTESFVQSLDPKSVKMLMLPRLGLWISEQSKS